jgi:RNA polymerase sigma-70 factor, ECF subfamily
MTDDEFEDNIDQARAGDSEALGRLWRAHNPALVRYLAGRGATSPQDTASAVWVEVAKNLGRFRGQQSHFRGWLFTLARYRHIDELRSPRTSRERLTREVPDTVACAGDSAEAVESNLDLQAVLGVVRQLHVDQRDAVLLRVVADLDVALTARLLGKSPGAVRVLTHRGLRNLARLLGGVTLWPATSVNKVHEDQAGFQSPR